MAKTSGGVQGGYRDGREQRRHPVQQRFDGARRRQVQENPVLVLFDLRRYFEEREDQRGGLRRGQWGVRQRVGAESMMEDIGGTGQEEPRGVREERRG